MIFLGRRLTFINTTEAPDCGSIVVLRRRVPEELDEAFAVTTYVDMAHCPRRQEKPQHKVALTMDVSVVGLDGCEIPGRGVD